MLVQQSVATVSWASVDLDCCLEWAVVGRRSVEKAGGRAANKSLYDACTRLKIGCKSYHGNEVAETGPLHWHACVGVSAFVVVCVALDRCPKHQCIQASTLQRCI